MNSIYNEELQKYVKDVFGKISELYLKMCAGEQISVLVKNEVRKKGKSFRIKDKKAIYQLCKEQEEKLRSSVVEL